MNNENSKLARRKFVGWLGVFSIGGVLANGLFSSVKPAPKTVRMLTQDGKLVEVDAAALNVPRKRITDDELQSWIKK